jgi:hypothetical protein
VEGGCHLVAAFGAIAAHPAQPRRRPDASAEGVEVVYVGPAQLAVLSSREDYFQGRELCLAELGLGLKDG